jgi:hypothetical protein
MTAQIAGCNGLHDAEKRLARWFLMVWDRTQENDLNFTQEYLAEVIAVERTTVTAIARDMQRKGIVEYSRGKWKILNREKPSSSFSRASLPSSMTPSIPLQ